jgi:hypothetical protein
VLKKPTYSWLDLLLWLLAVLLLIPLLPRIVQSWAAVFRLRER